MSDSSRRGFLESQAKCGWWAVKFADKSRNIRATDLELLSSDADSAFDTALSLAPLGAREKHSLSAREKRRDRSSAPESTRKRHRLLPEGAAADSDSDECPVCLEVIDAATAVLLGVPVCQCVTVSL